MKMSLRGVFNSLAVTLLCASPLYLGSVAHAAADTCTWTGLGADTNLSTALNWTGCDNGNVPENGDSLAFPLSVASNKRIVNNDIANFGLAGLTMSGAAASNDFTGYVLQGSPVVVSGNVTNSSNRTLTLNSSSVILGASVSFVGSTNGSVQVGSYSSSTVLDMGAYTLTLDPAGSNYTIFSELVGGGATLNTNGDFVSLESNSPTFDGGINVQSGILYAQKEESLGSVVSATYVNAGASISLGSCSDEGTVKTFAEPLHLSGASANPSTPKIWAGNTCQGGLSVGDTYGYRIVDAEYNLTGSIQMQANTTFGAAAFTTTITGPVSGNYTLDLFSGTPYGGTLIVESSNNTSLTPNGSYAPDAQNITLTDDQPTVNVGVMNNSEVIVNGTRSSVSVNGGTLKGRGNVGSLFMSDGIVAPGMSPGCLTSSNLTYTGGTVQIELNGTTVCTEYDQQIVNGTVDLGSATTLDIQRLSTFAPAINTVFTIINNDGTDAVTGTFAGQAQGSTIVLGSYTYTISYTGGDGNDVTLTVTSAPAAAKAPNTGFVLLRASLVTPMLAIFAGVAVLVLKRQQKSL